MHVKPCGFAVPGVKVCLFYGSIQGMDETNAVKAHQILNRLEHHDRPILPLRVQVDYLFNGKLTIPRRHYCNGL